MGAIGYYYSKDGTDSNGPVPEDVLRQLFQKEVISTTSYLCREGESDWHPFNPAIFQDHAPLPPPQPPRSSSRIRIQKTVLWISHDQIWDPRFRRMLHVITLIVVLATAAIGVHLRYVVFADTQMATDSLWDILEYFVGFSVMTFALPWLVSQAVRPSRRPLALVIGAICAAPLVVCLLYYTFAGNATVDTALAALQGANPTATSDMMGQTQAAKRLTATDLTHAEAVLQELTEAAKTDKTDMSVVRNDLVTVIDTLSTKCKACDAAAAACPRFSLATISSLDDLHNRQEALGQLRDAQGDLNSYLQNIVMDCREALSRDDFAPATVTEAIVGFRKSAQIDQLTDLASVAMKISDDQAACLKLLADNWGHWRMANGAINFDDSTTLLSYNQDFQTLQDDLKAQQDLQKQ